MTTEKLPINTAIAWIDGHISTGKLIHEFGVPRPLGDDLVGAIWSAYDLKLREFKSKLESRLRTAEANKQESIGNGSKIDKAADSALCRAYVTALSDFQLEFGIVMQQP